MQPGAITQESTVKIFRSPATSIDSLINFTDSDLLAAGYYINNNGAEYMTATVIIFDREIFNQDIYVTHSEVSGSEPVNYYIELEQISLDLNGSTVATLQSMRTSPRA